MGQLRDRMLEDMRLRRLRPNTQKIYTRCVRDLAKYARRQPDRLDTRDVRAFLLHLVDERKVATATHRIYVAAFRFFFRVTARRPHVMSSIPNPRRSKPLPVILTGSEVEQLIEAAPTRKQRACFLLGYGAGLRVSEIVALRIDDVDSKRHLIRIRDAKGSKDRYVMLSPRLLEELRDYYRRYRPEGPALFPGRRPGTVLTRQAVHRAVHRAAQRAGLCKRVSPHALRHAFATHLMELGTHPRVLQALLGHASAASTDRYLHVAPSHIARVQSPLDLLGTEQASKLD